MLLNFTHPKIVIQNVHHSVHHNITILDTDPNTGHLCSICSEVSKSIVSLFKVIKNLEFEFKVQSIKKYTRQEQIAIVSHWLGYVNLSKLALYKISEVNQEVQANFCKINKEADSKYIGTIENFISQLVDIIQKTIRQQNLNLSLILLT